MAGFECLHPPPVPKRCQHNASARCIHDFEARFLLVMSVKAPGGKRGRLTPATQFPASPQISKLAKWCVEDMSFGQAWLLNQHRAVITRKAP